MKTAPCFSMFASALMLVAGDAFGQPKDIRVLPDVAVTAPSATIQKELAAFSGRWSGYYNGANTGAYMSEGLIVVEKIVSPSEIQVFYSGVGRHRSNYGNPWTYRINATFVDGALEFKAGTCVITARMTDERTIAVDKTCRGSNRGTYKRIAD